MLLLWEGVFIIREAEFIVNNISSRELHSFLETAPVFSMPKRKFSTIEIPGASRQKFSDENSYENRTGNLTIIVKADNEFEKTLYLSKLYKLFDTPDYIEFISYLEPNFAYHIKISDAIDVSRLSRLSNWQELKLKVTADAFKYYVPPNKYLNINQLTIHNQFPFSSKPLIEVPAGGDLNLQINNKSYKFTGLPTNAMIDCDELQQDVYANNQLYNSTFDATQEFPELPTGDININSNLKINLYPRWRLI